MKRLVCRDPFANPAVLEWLDEVAAYPAEAHARELMRAFLKKHVIQYAGLNFLIAPLNAPRSRE